MLETLKTLRLTHLTLIGVSAGALLMAAGGAPDTRGALYELDVFRSLLSPAGIERYYDLCNRAADEFQAPKLPGITERMGQLITERGRAVATERRLAIKLHGDFAVRYFGFCDAPPIDGTLEDYESFLIEPQYVGVHTLSDVALQQALDAVDEIVDPVPDRLEILYIQSFIPGGIALPGRQRVEELERLRATRETTWGEWFNPPLHIRVMLSIRRSREFNCGGAIRCTTRIDSIPEPIGLDWLSRAAPWMVAAPSTSDEGMDLPPVLFPRLKRFWPSIRSKTVDEARAYLEGLEHQRVEQEITLLGLRFTRLLAIRALPLVILLVLGYFCVHLRHIRHLLAKSGEGSADDLVASFPWVGFRLGERCLDVSLDRRSTCSGDHIVDSK
jgi:hypothetical protein